LRNVGVTLSFNASTSIGVPIQRNNSDSSWTWKPYDDDNPGPLVTFKFIYRTYAILQAQGIVPEPELDNSELQESCASLRTEGSAAGGAADVDGSASGAEDGESTSAIASESSQGVIAEDDGVKEEEEESDVDTATVALLQKQMADIQELLQNLTSKKKRRLEQVDSNANAPPSSRVKREASPIRVRRDSADDDRIVIDLTCED